MTQEPEIERVLRLLAPPLVSIPTLSKALGISEEQAYEAVRLGQFYTVPIGKQLRVPTAPLKRKLGLERFLESESPTPTGISNAAIEGGDAAVQ